MKCRDGTGEPNLRDITLPSESQDTIQDPGRLCEKSFLRPLEHLRGHDTTQGLAQGPQDIPGFREALPQFVCGLAEPFERVAGLCYTRVLVGVQSARQVSIGIRDVRFPEAAKVRASKAEYGSSAEDAATAWANAPYLVSRNADQNLLLSMRRDDLFLQ
jgi:hypothetical protein